MKANKKYSFFVLFASALFLADVIILVVFTATKFFEGKAILEASLIG